MTVLRLAAFLARHLALLAVVAVAAHGLGRAALRRLGVAREDAPFAFATVFGLGALSTLLFAAAAVRLLVWPVVAALLAAGAALDRPWGAEWRGRWTRAAALLRPGPGIAVAAVGLAVVGPMALAAHYPALDPDSTMYHLPAARAFAAAHGIPALPALRYPVFPQLHELLGAAAFHVSDAILAQLLNLLWCLLAAGVLWEWGRRSGDRRVGGLAAALWLGSPMVLGLARSAHVELAVAAFGACAALAADTARERRDARWWAIAGALAGWAAGTKYTGLWFVAALGLAALVLSGRGARLRAAGAFAAAALAAGGPWYVRSWVLAGNPVWPFLGNVFGYRFWIPRDLSSAVWSLKHEGGPHTWGAFFAFPWTSVRDFRTGPARLSPVLWGLFPIGVLGVLLARRRRWLAALAAGYGVFWFWTTQQPRFLVPILPVAAFVAAAGLLALAGPLVAARGRPATLVLLVVLAAAALAPRLVDQARLFRRLGPPPFDARSRDAFLERVLPSYPLYRALNAAHGADYVIYAFYDEPMLYYCRGTHLGEWFGRGRYVDVDVSTGERLYASLRKLGAGYLLVNAAIIPMRLPDDTFFQTHFQLIFQRASIRAWRLR